MVQGFESMWETSGDRAVKQALLSRELQSTGIQMIGDADGETNI